MLTFDRVLTLATPFIKAALILIVGHYLIVYFVKLVKRFIKKSRLDDSHAVFLSKTVSTILHLLIVLSALNSLGISTTGILATLSAAAVAIGLALKDSLGNIAGGILLLVAPRFSAGDFIEAAGESGTVTEVDLLHTTIRTPDNKQISIPNGTLVNSDITNYSREEFRRVDITFPIPYESDPEKAKKVIKETIKKHPLVLAEPDDVMVRVLSYGDSSVNIVTRSWCNTADYWSVYFDLTEQVRAELENQGISMPYNKLDVNVISK